MNRSQFSDWESHLDPPLLILDGTRGKDFIFKAGKRQTYEASRYGTVALQTQQNYQWLTGNTLVSLVRRISRELGLSELVFQAGPPVYRSFQQSAIPSDWVLLRTRRSGLLYRVPMTGLDSLGSFFDAVASYEVWTFYLIRDRTTEIEVPVDLHIVDMDILERRSIAWDALLVYEGEFGHFFSLLPRCVETDRVLQKMNQEGLAVWPDNQGNS